MATTASLLDLPFDACLLIFAHLDVSDLVGVLCTCKTMQSLAKVRNLLQVHLLRVLLLSQLNVQIKLSMLHRMMKYGEDLLRQSGPDKHFR